MAGSRGFLLVLLAATVTCIVVVQVSLDGWILNGAHFSLLNQGKEQKEISATSIEINNAKSSKPNTTVAESSSTKATTAANSDQLKQPPRRASLSFANSSVNLARNPPFTLKRVHPKPSQQVQANVRVRELQFRKRPNMMLGHQNRQKILVDRQTRLQEILKHSDAIQSRARGDPMRALKPLPIIKPENVTRVIVLTYFRSGSSFLGELLQQNWKTFYQFEPLHYMTYDSRITDNKTAEALDLFNNIYRCNFTNLGNYFKWAKHPKNQFLFAHSLFLWFSCRTNPRMCFSPEFVSAVCHRSPVQVTKVTRLHMRHLRSFLQENSDLGIKVVFLTRDPRGIVSSRWTLDWCNGTECSDPNVLCNEMTEDINIFRELQRKDPMKFVHIRYEDLTMNPEKEAAELFKFLRLPFSQAVQRFLKSHTIARKVDNLDPYSTRRNSSSMAFSWRQRFSFEQVKSVQASCSSVIKQLNHSLITSPSELDHPNVLETVRKINFSPLTRVNSNVSKLLLSIKSKSTALNNSNVLTTKDSVSAKTLPKSIDFVTLNHKKVSPDIVRLITPFPYSKISQKNPILNKGELESKLLIPASDEDVLERMKFVNSSKNGIHKSYKTNESIQLRNLSENDANNLTLNSAQVNR